MILALALALIPPAGVDAADCPSGPVALTFDDGPAGTRTHRVLDVLESRDAIGTFFVNGHSFAGDPETLRRIAADGHVVANHTWGHAYLPRLSDAVVRRELLDTVAAAASAGVTMAPLVRPPFGATNQRVESIMSELGMTAVMWTIDPQDWRGRSASWLTAHVVRRLYAGANVLFHDGSPSSRVAAALPAILDEMARRGFCPGVFDSSGAVVPASAAEPPAPEARLPCIGPEPCDSVGVVDAAGRWQQLDELATGASATAFWFGDPGDTPLTGDWDCDGVDTPGMHRPSTGGVHLRNTNTSGPAEHVFTFGDPGDVLLAGDWDGDGCDTLAVYRTGEQRMYASNRLGARSAEAVFAFGDPGDVPFVGDFDGDGRDDLGLHRPSSGAVYYRLEMRSGPADGRFTFGDPGDVIVAGDWDGDGVDTPALYRASTGTWYFTLTNGGGPADHTVRGWPPVPVVTAVAGAFRS